MRCLRFALLGLTCLLTGFMPQQGRAPVRWALIVGVGDYLNYQDEIGGDLMGAANDARGIHEVLIKRWGFEPRNVRLLLDREATRAAIQQQLTQWLPSVVQPNDVVIFYFAGHGSQSWDENGDEADGLDETICPTDVLRNGTTQDIVDDELEAWLNRIPTQKLTVILDSCHSGTATRAVVPFTRPRTLARALTGRPAASAPVNRSTARGIVAGTGTLGLGDRVLEIAAAQADQLSMEALWDDAPGTASRPGGVFTTPLIRYLWQVPLGTTYEELFHLTREAVKERGFEQDPSLSVNTSRGDPVFMASGPTASGPVRAGRVLSVREDDSIVIEGGEGAGVTPGTLYSVGTGVYRVTAVSETSALATLAIPRESISPATAAAIGSDAVMIAYATPTPTLSADIGSLPLQAQTQLTSLLRDQPNITLQRLSIEYADLLIRSSGARYTVLGADGQERAVLANVDSVAKHLRKELASRQIAALENPTHPFRLDFSFSGERTEFRVGERAHFQVRSERAGYLTIVDVGATGTVNVVYPDARFGSNGRIEAGQTISLPDAGATAGFMIEEPVGRGIVRAFVTERPMVLSAVGGGGSADMVVEALRIAAGQPRVPGPAIPVGSWATASIHYRISR